MNGMTGGRGPRRGGITAPPRVVIARPRDGWVLGLLGLGIKTLAGLVAAVMALAVLAGVTVVLWWAGEVTVPLVVLAYLSAVLPVCGFAVGCVFCGGLPRFLPRGPEQVTWEPGAGRVRAGLVWELDTTASADDPAAVMPEPPQQENWRFPGGEGL